MFPSLPFLNINTACRRADCEEREEKPELTIKDTTSTLEILPRLKVLNLGTVSAVEMILAKLILDALINKRTTPVHKYISAHYSDICPIVLLIEEFRGKIEEAVGTNQDDDDLKRWKRISDMLKEVGEDPDEWNNASGDVFVRFLEAYANEGGIEMEDLRGLKESPGNVPVDKPYYGSKYRAGINGVLKEYVESLGSLDRYATNLDYNHTVRLFAKLRSGKTFCIAIVMMSYHDRPHDSFRIQGIISCSIYRRFQSIPIGNTFLSYFTSLATKTERLILASPIGNPQWEEKLKRTSLVQITDV